MIIKRLNPTTYQDEFVNEAGLICEGTEEQAVLKILDAEAVKNDTPITDLKVVKKGTVKDLNDWAKAQGFRWKTDAQNLFGGYYVDDKDEKGDVYYFDTATGNVNENMWGDTPIWSRTDTLTGQVTTKRSKTKPEDDKRGKWTKGIKAIPISQETGKLKNEKESVSEAHEKTEPLENLIRNIFLIYHGVMPKKTAVSLIRNHPDIRKRFSKTQVEKAITRLAKEDFIAEKGDNYVWEMMKETVTEAKDEKGREVHVVPIENKSGDVWTYNIVVIDSYHLKYNVKELKNDVWGVLHVGQLDDAWKKELTDKGIMDKSGSLKE